MNTSRHAARNRSWSNVPSSRRNFIRLMLARLQAESSTNMYSEQLWTTMPLATNVVESGSVRSKTSSSPQGVREATSID